MDVLDPPRMDAATAILCDTLDDKDPLTILGTCFDRVFHLVYIEWHELLTAWLEASPELARRFPVHPPECAEDFETFTLRMLEMSVGTEDCPGHLRPQMLNFEGPFRNHWGI